MATDAVLLPHDVHTRLNYYAPIGTVTEAPYRYFGVEPPAGKPVTNVGQDWRDAVVHDVRGREQDFSLDENGFQFMHWECGEEDAVFDDEKLIRDRYYPKVEELLKQVTGGRGVFIFGHNVRGPVGNGNSETNVSRNPVVSEIVHSDGSSEQGPRHVRRLFPTEADQLLKGRVRMFTVWKPIHRPVAQHPLGLLDWRCVNEHDLVCVRNVFPDREDFPYILHYNPAHRWYHLSSQTPDEIVIFKGYDSMVDKTIHCPHTAFVDASMPKEAPGRESIEVRAFVFDAE